MDNSALEFKILSSNDVELDFVSLFNQRNINSYNFPVYTFLLLKNHKNQLLITFSIKENIAYSSLIGPYAGFEIFELDFTKEEFRWFLNQMIDFFQDLNVLKLIVKQNPFENKLIDHFLNDFKITYKEQNQFIELEKYSKLVLHHSAKRRLKKLEEAYFKPIHVQNPSENILKNAFELIQNNRNRKDYPLSLDYSSFINLFLKPQYYDFFVVYTVDNQMAACSVGVRINNKIAYHFMPADSEKFLNYSPSVMLYDFVANFYKKQNFQIFDLGISSFHEEINEGLFIFKTRMGGKSQNQIIYELEI